MTPKGEDPTTVAGGVYFAASGFAWQLVFAAVALVVAVWDRG